MSSEVLAVRRRIQAQQLKLEPERYREPRLAFGRGVLAQLTNDELRIVNAQTGEPRLSRPVPGARLVVALADGTLLAVGAQGMVQFDASNDRSTPLARPMLLPGAQLHADAITAGRIWVFDELGADGAAAPQPQLSSMTLDPARAGVLLPDRSAAFALPAGGVLGRTREGVWLYAKGRSLERLGPGGARLSKVALPDLPELLALLPARRLDQCLMLERTRVSRVVVSPSFKRVAEVGLPGTPLTAAVGDEGRLLAIVVMTGEGPRFELLLFDAELALLGRVPLPSDAPTGDADWVKVVSQNQGVVVAPREARVVVGGPDRALVLDAQGKQIFSIPSR